MIYTKEEIVSMLTGYKEVKKNRIKDIPRYTRIRYYDDRFKAGGMLLNVNTDDKTITLKNGTFIWKVKIENIQKIWATDPEILRQKEKDKRIDNDNKKDKQREREELDKCKALLTMVKKGEVQIVKKGVKK